MSLYKKHALCLLHLLILITVASPEPNNTQTYTRFEDGIKTTYEVSVNSEALTLRQAASYCDDLGPGWEVALSNTNKEHQLLQEVVQDQAWNSTWTPLKRKIYRKFKWIHGQPIYKTMKGKGNCGRLLVDKDGVDKSQLGRAPCSLKRRGFVCQAPGACPLVSQHPCLDDLQSDQHFMVFCLVRNWFSARSECESHDGQLAVVDSPSLKRKLSGLVQNLTGRCQHSVWVGFTKVAFEKYHPSQANLMVPLLPLWHKNEPRTSSHSCVILDRKEDNFLWSATKCATKHNSICWKRSSYHVDGTDIDYSFHIHNSKVNMSEASNVCNNTKGADWELVQLYNNESDLIVANVMKHNGITSVWTGIKRNMTTNLKWINGKLLDYQVDGKGKCGRLIVSMNSSGIFQSVTAISCNVVRTGYLCQYNGCPKGVLCQKIDEWYYSYWNKRTSWESAYQSCHRSSGTLAILDDQTHSDHVARTFLGEEQGLFEAWIGLTKAEFIDNQGTVVSSPVPDLWHQGHPVAEKHCVIIKHHNDFYLMATVTCGQKHHVICVNSKPSMWASTTCCYYYKMEFFICAAIVAGCVLAVLITLIGFCIYKCRKKYEKPYSDLKKPLVINTNSSTMSSSTNTGTPKL